MLIMAARRLANFACLHDWPAVLTAVLPIATIGCRCVREALQVLQAVHPESLTLMHLAVLSASVPMLECMHAWVKKDGYKSGCLAAMLGDKGVMADRCEAAGVVAL